MIALLAIPVFLFIFGALYYLLVIFHITSAMLIFGCICLLFIISTHRQLKKAQTFRSEWMAMQAKNITPGDAWENAWRRFMYGIAIFLAVWAALITFTGIYFTLLLSIKAGASSKLLLAVFFPMIVAYSGIVATMSAGLGCLFAWLWVRTSPFIALMTTSVPIIVISSMAITMILHLR